jgi:NDP-sugar pyrophosphorylase family protein
MNIIIPASGKGQRFVDAGYPKPKPFLNVDGLPMICRVTENVRSAPNDNIFWIVRDEHLPEAEQLAKPYQAHCVPVKNVTQGAACTALLACACIDNDEPVIVANSDQIVDFSMSSFLLGCYGAQGGILCFPATGTKWSYARIDSTNHVLEVAEKVQISQWATAGIYYFSSVSLLTTFIEKMINSGIRVRDEFYLAPVFNELILEHLKVMAVKIGADHMHGLGTPEDYAFYCTR